jgi:uncharacterized protein with PCYCGC motif
MRLNGRSLFPLAGAAFAAAMVWSARAAATPQNHGPNAPARPPAAANKAPAAANKASRNSCSSCLERGALLDPNQFSKGYEPEVKLAYQAAQKYPDTIDRIHCFCECKESQRENHKTLLTCFTNLHAAGCGICQHEALMAAKMKSEGASDDDVEITVESLSKTEGHPPTFGRGN